jgi:CheY-like chemotaxis protein
MSTPPQHGAHILFVEDNDLTLEVVPLLIREAGASYTVDTAPTAQAAIEQAESNGYDLFLIDINLGAELTGVDVMKALRDRPEYAHTPMIACTAYAMPGDEERFLSHGFDAYVPKPFKRDHLLDVMDTVLGR